MSSGEKRLRNRNDPDFRNEKQERAGRLRFKKAQAVLRSRLGGIPLREDPFDWLVSDYGDEPNTPPHTRRQFSE